MARNIIELRKQIEEKNRLLELIRRENNGDKERVHTVKCELDALLYKYYKSLKYDCNNTIICHSTIA